jgi:gliding motility-associated-like protein
LREKQLIFWSFLCLSFFGICQESYNLCSDALELCPGETVNVNNIGANSTFCPNCEDDFNFCFQGENTVWFRFQTNAAGGDVQVFFSNLIFENAPGQGNQLQAVVLRTLNPCIASSYTTVSNCTNNETTDFVLNAVGLAPNTTYFIVVNGAMGATDNAEASFDILVNGPGVQRNPSIAIGVSATVACVGQSITFSALVTNCENQQNIHWFADGVFMGETTENLFITDQLSQTATITAQVECFENCSETLVSEGILITVTSFLVDAGPDFEIIAGESVQLQGATSETDFFWTPAFNMNNASILSPVVNPVQTITYYLTASNGDCSITDFCVVYVTSALEIPNTFTPNGDNVNDSWEILGIEKFPDAYVQVFDRWGQLVFQSNGYPPSKRWDGRKNGRELAPSSYYYVIDVRDENFPDVLKGFVSIVR